MEHPLKSLLQVQLASDSTTVVHLPYTLRSLNSECFDTSSHSTKWTTRINSLLHSKDAGARWAGLCLAQKTALLSRSLLLEHAQSWLGTALPLLARNEPLPTLKASIRLIATIFSETVGVPEFQRQVTISHVPKFTAAMLSLIEKSEDNELKATALLTFGHLIPLYPTLHKASHTSLYNITLRFLSGSAPHPTNTDLLHAASKLFSVLPLTGGKVGAVSIWRKFMDETLEFGWNAFYALRTTFAVDGRSSSSATIEDATIQVPLNLDRLRCCSTIICDLLKSPCQRSVQLPLGSLIRFVTTLLRCTKDDPAVAQFDPSVRTLELSVISDIWKHACCIISGLAVSAESHLVPYLTTILSAVIFHLEQNPSSHERHFLLETVCALFQNCPPADAPLVSTRLARAILPPIAVVLEREPESQAENGTTSTGQDKKGKKRARAYEGDEIFKLSGVVLCPSQDDELALLSALETLKLLLQNYSLSPSLQSLCSRVVLSLLITLPQIPPATLSPNLTLHGRLLSKVQDVSVQISAGTSSAVSKSLGLVCRLDGGRTTELQNQLEILLHPRAPPLVRSLPHVENLALFRAEETQDELDIRQELGFKINEPTVSTFSAPSQSTTQNNHSIQMEQDVRMAEVNEPQQPKQQTYIEQPPQAQSQAPANDVPPARRQESQQPPAPAPSSNFSKAPDISSSEAPPTSRVLAPGVEASSSQVALTSQPRTVSISMAAPDDEDEDEEMPSINMESDSEEEDDE